MTEAATRQPDAPSAVTALLRPVEDRAAPTPAIGLSQALQRECEVMVHYALDHGRELSADLAQRAALVIAEPAVAATDHLAELTILHGALSALIAPARGRTLVLLQEERRAHPRLYAFGPVRLVRQMLGFAVFALAATLALSTLDTVDVDNVAKGWFGLGGGNAFCVLGFMLAVAALGTAFSNLSTINRYIEQANYDVTFEGSYWVRVVLGLISGVVLAEILFDLVVKNADAGGIAPAGERIVLAFLGGFATAPVQRLLTNLSDAIGTLLQGRGTSARQVEKAAAVPAAGVKPESQS